MIVPLGLDLAAHDHAQTRPSIPLELLQFLLDECICLVEDDQQALAGVRVEVSARDPAQAFRCRLSGRHRPRCCVCSTGEHCRSNLVDESVVSVDADCRDIRDPQLLPRR